MMPYTAHAVAELLRVPYSTLMRWVGVGLLAPEGARGGRRRATTWRVKDVREASILVALRRAGFSLQRLRAAMAYLRSIGHNPMSTGEFLVVRGGDGEPADLIKVCSSGEAIDLIRRRGQMVLPLWTPDMPD